MEEKSFSDLWSPVNGKNNINSINQVTNIRFVVIIYEGTHYFHYFSNEETCDVIYEFASQSVCLPRDQFVLLNQNKEEINPKLKIVSHFPGTTTGRVFITLQKTNKKSK